ncbi:general substrate transporter [Aspergillus neoniger CBS 115656]|uniref:General substrate transporter n=1 Tax=Aspergillus neoniger (strain CBS 115656) TaxID=1448310 RepID=A0A318Y7R5_ASPNB|nr:general substrate transporter [Aspergillus neoniger CBS 115656]PYH28363.1 general substrate transporter [Aspergillus neoniger CBS 115656]
MAKLSTLLSAVFLAIGGFLFGYDSGIITSTIGQTEFIRYFNNPNDTVTGGVVSAFQGGAILGTIINIFTGDRLGRKMSVFAGACISIVGCALQGGAINMTMLIIGRFIAGVAVGMLTATVPMYAGEMAEAASRGMMSGLLQWMLRRFPLSFQCVPGLVLMAGVWFLQESPRWLMEQDRHEEALATLHRLHGINVINYYGTRIYSSLGIETRTTLMIIGISGGLSIVYCTIGLWALERVGRIRPLIVSAAGMAAALVCNAAMSQHYTETNTNQLRAMVAMNFIFSLFYTSPGIISWVYPAEIFPVDIRNQGNSITTFTNWTVNLVFAQFSPTALSNIGFRYFYVFFVFNLIAMVCYIFFFPETRGKTLEQMDELFGDVMVFPGDVKGKEEPQVTMIEDAANRSS